MGPIIRAIATTENNKIKAQLDSLFDSTELSRYFENRCNIQCECFEICLERKLVILLESQQSELDNIRKAQTDRREIRKMNYPHPPFSQANSEIPNGPSLQDKEQASKLIESTEAMMKFGFMSMGMTYFSSMNMVKALKTVGAHEATSQLCVSSETPIPRMSRPSCKPQSQIYASVQRWSVDNVIDWLNDVLGLSQYKSSFENGAVDGSFLFALTDEDLRFGLGVEHKLHRKKILFHIDLLRKLENDQKGSTIENENEMKESQHLPSLQEKVNNVCNILQEASTNESHREINEMKNIDVSSLLDNMSPKIKHVSFDSNLPTKSISLEELFSWIRHNNEFSKTKEALETSFAHNKRFDNADIKVQYVPDIGTVYIGSYENALNFHINETDEYGNTLLHVAAQNGNLRIARLLVQKGANTNHQNKQGQTAAHFALAYQFFDFAGWMFDGGGADDTICNMYGLSPYDGLEDF